MLQIIHTVSEQIINYIPSTIVENLSAFSIDFFVGSYSIVTFFIFGIFIYLAQEASKGKVDKPFYLKLLYQNSAQVLFEKLEMGKK